MKQLLLATIVGAALGIAALAAQAMQSAQTGNGQTAQPPVADPYASNPDAGATRFPLAAPAGKDSNSKNVAPPGAVNQGAFDVATWKSGTAFNPPAGAKVWLIGS